MKLKLSRSDRAERDPSEADDIVEAPSEADDVVEIVEAPAASDEIGSSPDANAAEAATSGDSSVVKAGRRRIDWGRVLIFGALPGLALVLTLVAGFLKWQDTAATQAEVARIETVQVAKDATVALLSYKPDTAERELTAARDRLTGSFRDSYSQLTNEVVIPGAKQKQISATATVPAAGSVSADADRAVVMVFVNQTVIVGKDAPTDTASAVRITMEKVDNRWLISGFDPI